MWLSNEEDRELTSTSHALISRPQYLLLDKMLFEVFELVGDKLLKGLVHGLTSKKVWAGECRESVP